MNLKNAFSTASGCASGLGLAVAHTLIEAVAKAGGFDANLNALSDAERNLGEPSEHIAQAMHIATNVMLNGDAIRLTV